MNLVLIPDTKMIIFIDRVKSVLLCCSRTVVALTPLHKLPVFAFRAVKKIPRPLCNFKQSLDKSVFADDDTCVSGRIKVFSSTGRVTCYEKLCTVSHGWTAATVTLQLARPCARPITAHVQAQPRLPLVTSGELSKQLKCISSSASVFSSLLPFTLQSTNTIQLLQTTLGYFMVSCTSLISKLLILVPAGAQDRATPNISAYKNGSN